MDRDSFFLVGVITRTHGVKGNLMVQLQADHPEHYKKLKAVFLEENGLFVSKAVKVNSISGQVLNIHFEGVDDMTGAEKYTGRELYLPLEMLPELEPHQIYFHEAIGMRVIDSREGELGILEKVYDLPRQPVAAIAFNNKELLFPFVSEFIDKVDRQNKILYITLPEGLTDIYR